MDVWPSNKNRMQRNSPVWSWYFSWWLRAPRKRRKKLPHIRKACGKCWKEGGRGKMNKGGGRNWRMGVRLGWRSSNPELQTRLKTLELLQALALCTWLMGSNTSPLMPSPYRAILLLPVTFNSLRIWYNHFQVWMPPKARQCVNSLPLTELPHFVLCVLVSSLQLH